MRLFVLLLWCISAVSSKPSTSRIIGGEDIPIEKVPYQISLQENDAHSCGGSIITPSFIVTAAHCTDGKTEDELTVRAGTSTREGGGQVVNVKKINIHPNYRYDTLDHDVAVLELSSSLTLGLEVAPIDLPDEGQIWPEGTEALISGWGLLHEGDQTLPINLQGVSVQLFDQDTCNSAYEGELTETMFCAGVPEGGKDACQSDSGGPLQVEGILAGIISSGNGCGLPKFPGIYTNVTVVLNFIQDVINLK